jgi:hypothetical protein
MIYKPDKSVTWLEAWAGPADGELFPVVGETAVSLVPYLAEDGHCYWYRLEERQGKHQYVYAPTITKGPTPF